MIIPFLIHIVIELPAAINFFLHPSATLAVEQPFAHAIIRQYALLLMTSNLIALVFLFKLPDSTSRKTAGALALYHFGPLWRAGFKIWDGEGSGQRGLRGPWVHLIAHAVCAGALVLESIDFLQ